MFELVTKVLLASIAAGAALGTPSANAPVTVQAAVAFAALAFFSWRLRAREVRLSGVWMAVTAGESLAIAFALAGLGALEALSILALGPVVLGVRNGAPAGAAAPLSAASLLAAHVALAPSPIPSLGLIGGAIGVLAIGLLLPVPTLEVRLAPEAQAPGAADLPPTDRVFPANDEFLELRESYRRLRDAFREQERRGRKDRLLAQLLEARLGGGRGLVRIAAALRAMTGAESITIYTVAGTGDALVVRGAAGAPPEALGESSVHVDPSRPSAAWLQDVDAALAALLGDEIRSRTHNIALRRRGQHVGLICLVHGDPAAALEARALVEEVAGEIAGLVVEEGRLDGLVRRTREAELLYEVAGLAGSGQTPTGTAARIVRELGEILDCDHLSVVVLDGDRPVPLATHGALGDYLGALRLPSGPGVAGWRAEGAPEFDTFDARNDLRLEPEEALRRRIGSLAILPFPGHPTEGYLVAMSHRPGAIDAAARQALRTVAAEIGRVLVRADREAGDALLTPGEFANYLDGKRGQLVVLEPLHLDEATKTLGRPAVANSLRRLLARLRATLPANGALCRRAEGDLVAFLPDVDAEAAEVWANEASAIAALVGVRAADGSASLPLAIRAKTAVLDTQDHRFLSESVA